MKRMTAVVVDIKRLNRKFLLVRLQPEERFEYVAGQWVSVSIGNGEVRSYSVASAPAETGEMEMLVDVAFGGRGDRFFLGLALGDEVELQGPFGRFVISSGDERRLWIATGSGIAPIRAMLQQLAGERDERENILLWGLRHEEDEVLVEEWKRMEREVRGFRYELSLSRPRDDWKGKKGRVTDRIREMGDLSGWSVYVCGGRQMVCQVERLALAKGVERTRIHYEKFY